MTLSAIHTTSATSSLNSIVEAPGSSALAGPATQSVSLLPEPSILLGGDMSAEITALAVQTGQQEQRINTTAAETEDTIEDKAEQSQVDLMHQDASETRAGAWTSGLLQIGAGACSIASGVTSMAMTAGKTASAVSGILKGGSEGLMGGGTIAGGVSKAAATDDEALATASKALADAAQRSGATARDAQKSASDFVQSAIDFYREYQSTKAQEATAALHGA
jgi:hypothetical protein